MRDAYIVENGVFHKGACGDTAVGRNADKVGIAVNVIRLPQYLLDISQ